MGTPGLGYSLYLFDGYRGRHKDGLHRPLNGYGIKLYDSRDNPEPPIINSPVLNIEENSAGTVEFTLIAGAKGTIMINGDGYDGQITEITNDIWKYVCYMQSEIVIYRSHLKQDNTIEEKELWAGRVSSIKKDFYNNWSIVAEGCLAYLNDFSTTEQKWESSQGKNAALLINKIIGKKNNEGLYNKAVNDNITKIGGSSYRTINPGTGINPFAHLDTRIYVEYVSDQLQWKASTMVSNADNTFELSDGTTYNSALNSLISRFGGFFDIEYSYDETEGNTKGRSVKLLKWYADKQYKTSSSAQKIYFGINLLDYKEDTEDADFFTALYPLGSSQETKETVNADGSKSKITETKKIDIRGIGAFYDKKKKVCHDAGSPYIYNPELVEMYGFIEKKEKWEIRDALQLKNIAVDYYKDLAIGEPSITITAFDLKNLINTDFAKENYKQVDSLYLYDQINIISPNAPHNNYEEKTIPIVGIKIPIDKFPTNTEYTMTNKTLRKSGLAPGNLPGTKPEDNLPDPKPETDGEEPDPKPKDTIDYLPPVGGELGIDVNMPHYPPVNLRRAASRWECRLMSIHATEDDDGTPSPAYSVFYNGDSWVDTQEVPNSSERKGKPWLVKIQEYDPSTQTRHWVSTDHYIDWTSPTTIGQVGYQQDYVKQGYFATAQQMDLHNAFTSSANKPFSFYCDDMSDKSTPMMRIKKNTSDTTEKHNDYYEKATTDPSIRPEDVSTYVNPVNSFYNANSMFYNHDEANAIATQPWRSHFNKDKKTVSLNYEDFVLRYINEELETGFSKDAYDTTLERVINSEIPCLDNQRVNSVLSEIGMSFSLNTSNNAFEISMTFNPEGDGNATIKRTLSTYYRDNDSNERNVGLVASWTNAEQDTTVIYYAYMNGEDAPPIPSGLTSDRTINGAYTYTDSLKERTSGYSAAVSMAESTVTSLMACRYKYPSDEYDLAISITSLVLGGGGTEKRDNIIARNGGNTIFTYTDDYNKTVTVDLMEIPTDPANSIKAKLLHGGGEESTTRETYNTAIQTSVKAKLFQSIKPILVITKTKNVGAGSVSDSYGVIFSGLAANSTYTLTKNESYYTLTGDILLSTLPQAVNPMMFCKDTLNVDGRFFKWYDDTSTIGIPNSSVIPKVDNANSNSMAPTLILTHCGGLHTTWVSTGAYLYLSGDFSFASPNTAWKTTLPAYDDGEPDSYPNGYNSIRHDSTEYTWYYNGGRDKPIHTLIPGGQEEMYKAFEDTSAYIPLCVGSDLFIKVGPVYIKK